MKSLKFKVQSSELRGFTLVEMLVVISIIAVIVALSLPNYLGARERARDTKRKSELAQMKAALRLYYNDYKQYPDSDLGIYIKGCGTAGTTRCNASSAFSAGPAGNETIYMRLLPPGYASEYFYNRNPARPSDTDDFLLKVALDNASDPDIATSQSRCGVTGLAGIGTKDYVVCAD